MNPQGFVHHLFVAASAQEVPFGGDGEGPDVAVSSVLTPAGLVGVDHQAGPEYSPAPGPALVGPFGPPDG